MVFIFYIKSITILTVSLIPSLVVMVAATDYGTCKSCYDGYTGNQCSQPVCYGNTSCMNGGTCSSPNNCTCPDKYVGLQCEQATCFGNVTCPNGGTCISPDNCSCAGGYSGERCETEVTNSEVGDQQADKGSINQSYVLVSFVGTMQIILCVLRNYLDNLH